MPIESKEFSQELAALVDAKLAEDIVILDMRELVTYTDFLILCTARNERQAEAIADEVHLRMKRDRKILPLNPDRAGDVGWTVLDYLDCVLHVFTAEARERYNLEDLWHEAPKETFEPVASGESPEASSLR